MNDIALKYRLLDKNGRKEVNDFMDFLLSRRKINKSKQIKSYKKRILTVSTWTDEDLKVFKKNAESFNNWKIEEW